MTITKTEICVDSIHEDISKYKRHLDDKRLLFAPGPHVISITTETTALTDVMEPFIRYMYESHHNFEITALSTQAYRTTSTVEDTTAYLTFKSNGPVPTEEGPW